MNFRSEARRPVNVILLSLIIGLIANIAIHVIWPQDANAATPKPIPKPTLTPRPSTTVKQSTTQPTPSTTPTGWAPNTTTTIPPVPSTTPATTTTIPPVPSTTPAPSWPDTARKLMNMKTTHVSFVSVDQTIYGARSDLRLEVTIYCSWKSNAYDTTSISGSFPEFTEWAKKYLTFLVPGSSPAAVGTKASGVPSYTVFKVDVMDYESWSGTAADKIVADWGKRACNF